MPLVLSRENILLAYRNIKNNTGSKTAGTDKLTIADIGKLTPEEVTAKVKYIVSGTKRGYRPKPVRRKDIPKPNGTTRPLGIPLLKTQSQMIIQLQQAYYANVDAWNQRQTPARKNKAHTKSPNQNARRQIHLPAKRYTTRRNHFATLGKHCSKRTRPLDRKQLGRKSHRQKAYHNPQRWACDEKCRINCNHAAAVRTA